MDTMDPYPFIHKEVYVPHLARKINSSTLSLVALLEQSWKMHCKIQRGNSSDVDLLCPQW